MTLKLNLFFIAMDILTLMAYPIVFVHGKICRFFKSYEVLFCNSLNLRSRNSRSDFCRLNCSARS